MMMHARASRPATCDTACISDPDNQGTYKRRRARLCLTTPRGLRAALTIDLLLTQHSSRSPATSPILAHAAGHASAANRPPAVRPTTFYARRNNPTAPHASFSSARTRDARLLARAYRHQQSSRSIATETKYLAPAIEINGHSVRKMGEWSTASVCRADAADRLESARGPPTTGATDDGAPDHPQQRALPCRW